MSIIIKGMDMPTNCGDCYFEQIGAEEDDYGDTCISYCLITEWRIALSNRDDKKLPSCPLVEIPTPHGRLIDEDTLNFHYEKEDGVIVYDAPTILEAEE